MHHRIVQIQKLLKLSMRSEFRRGVRFGVGASIEHLDMLRGLHIATLVDVGANVGQFTLLATALNPALQVEAFEPLAAPSGTFRRLFRDNARVRLHQCAIGAAEATVSMNVSRRDDSSSLLPISSLQEETFPGTSRVGTESVRVTTLASEIKSDRIAPPAFLKLDVQGYELEALRGSAGMLGLFQYVYVELSFVELYRGQALAPEVIAFLASAGFHIAGVYNLQSNAEGKSIQCDCLFTRATDP